MQKTAALSALSLVLFAAGIARAQPAPGAASTDADLARAADAPRYSFGVRVGGYGFRNTSEPDAGTWDDCRMDGAGLFAQRSLGRHLFAEAAFDLYTAVEGTPTAEMPVPGMDRISGLTTVAGGARIPWRWFSPYVQVGMGLEVTRVKMAAEGLQQHQVLPMGFFGVGADLRVTDHLSVGGNIRSNLMKHFDHDGGAAAREAGEAGPGEMSGEYEAAAQGQFFVRYEM